MDKAGQDRSLRVGVIGAGYFAQLHHDAWRRIDRAELVAVADRDMAKAESSGVTAHGDAVEMLAAVRPDIVDIATPPDTHLAMIEAALRHGARAIVCQKPFCGDLMAARVATAMAGEASTPLIVHENFRFQPWYRTLRKEIRDRTIGDILQVTFRLRPGDGQGPDAYLDRQPYFQTMPRFLIHETGVHWVDTFRFLLGEPGGVYADLRRLNPAIAGEDAGYFIFHYPTGARALFDGNRLLDHAAENRRLTMGECIVEGTTGEIRIGGDGAVRLRLRGGLEETVRHDAPPTDRFGGDCVFHLQSHVVAGILDGTAFENEATDYLRVMELEERIYESAESGCRLEAPQP